MIGHKIQLHKRHSEPGDLGARGSMPVGKTANGVKMSFSMVNTNTLYL